jgi:hypothetical protein
MKVASIFIAMLAPLSVAIWTSDASAQRGWAERAANCRARVQAQYPTAQERGTRSSRAVLTRPA